MPKSRSEHIAMIMRQVRQNSDLAIEGIGAIEAPTQTYLPQQVAIGTRRSQQYRHRRSALEPAQPDARCSFDSCGLQGHRQQLVDARQTTIDPPTLGQGLHMWTGESDGARSMGQQRGLDQPDGRTFAFGPAHRARSRWSRQQGEEGTECVDTDISKIPRAFTIRSSVEPGFEVAQGVHGQDGSVPTTPVRGNRSDPLAPGQQSHTRAS